MHVSTTSRHHSNTGFACCSTHRDRTGQFSWSRTRAQARRPRHNYSSHAPRAIAVAYSHTQRPHQNSQGRALASSQTRNVKCTLLPAARCHATATAASARARKTPNLRVRKSEPHANLPNARSCSARVSSFAGAQVRPHVVRVRVGEHGDRNDRPPDLRRAPQVKHFDLPTQRRRNQTHTSRTGHARPQLRPPSPSRTG